MNLQVLGGRKFILTVGCAAVSSFLLWFTKLDGGQYVTIILGTVAAYIVGGTVDNWKAKKAE